MTFVVGLAVMAVVTSVVGLAVTAAVTSAVGLAEAGVEGAGDDCYC